MSLLERIGGPRDLKALPAAQLPALAQEIRDLPRRPGRPHRRAPRPQPRRRRADHRHPPGLRQPAATAVVFDTGHQAYVHKLLTGRHDVRHAAQGGRPVAATRAGRVRARHRRELARLDRRCPTRDGLAKAYVIRGEDRHVVAVIGDGALTGGMAWEALNNIAAEDDLPPGHRRQRQRALLHPDRRRPRRPPHHAAHQPALRAGPRLGQDAPQRASRSSAGAMYDALHAVKKGMKDALAPQGLFEDLGLKYVGPVDGHDRGRHRARARARPSASAGPVHRARRSPARASATTPPSATRPTSSTRSGSIRRRDRLREIAQGPHLDRRLRRRDGRAGRASATTSSPSPPR